MCGGVGVWVSLQEVHCGCTFKYEFTLWVYFGIAGYPHNESHSNARRPM